MKRWHGMTSLLERAGASFLRAFGAGMLVYSTGILAAPDLPTATALGAAAVASSISSGLRAMQEFVPEISFKPILGDFYGGLADAFTRAFVGYGLTAAAGWFAAPDLATWRAVGLAAITGAITVGLRALQGLLTPGERPNPGNNE